jgi:hypothetical protein
LLANPESLIPSHTSEKVYEFLYLRIPSNPPIILKIPETGQSNSEFGIKTHEEIYEVFYEFV